MKNADAAEKIRQARSCIACGRTARKNELLRIVRTSEGTAVYDPTGRANGRGAYLCCKCGCVERAQKKELVAKHLNVVPDADFFEQLKQVCGE